MKDPESGRESRGEQDRFAWDRKTRVFQHHAKEDDPVAVFREKVEECLEDVHSFELMVWLLTLTLSAGAVTIILTDHSLSGGQRDRKIKDTWDLRQPQKGLL